MLSVYPSEATIGVGPVCVSHLVYMLSELFITMYVTPEYVCYLNCL